MRQRTILAFAAICSMPFILSGCFGLLTAYPTECSVDLPLNPKYNQYPNYWDSTSDKEVQRYKDLFVLSNKSEFLEKWGKPDEIITVSDNEEILVYNNSVWCGIIPAWVIGAPLVLPVCDGFDRVTFKDNKAVHIDFRKQSGAGIMFPIGPLVTKNVPCGKVAP
jgi:hypothetical protein